MTTLPRQLLTDTGLKAAYSPAAEQSVTNNGKLILHIKNDSDTKVTVTLITGYTRNGLKLADRVVSIEAGETVFIGPLPIDVYNNSGNVLINYSHTEDVYIAALQEG